MDQGLPAAACAGSPVWPDEGGLLGQQGDQGDDDDDDDGAWE